MRPDDMIAKAIKSAAEAKVARAVRVKVTTLPAQYMGTDSEGKGWVMLPGAAGPTPVRRMAVEAKAGDTVAVTVGYGRAVVDSNISNPSAGTAGVAVVRKTAQTAQSTATEAAKDAQAAIGYATSARAAADDARSQANVAATEAQAATGHAQQALSGAQTARDAAERATADAATASEMAVQATASAKAAGDAAAAAQEQAGIATTAANDALVQLAEVEDVMGTVEWIAEHGTYEPTQDAAVDGSKVYYVRTGSGTQADPYVYTAVPEPTDEGLSTYYELHVDQAVSQYVSTHLALTDAGLYVLADASGYKLLLANTGMSVIDPQGHVVVTYGESIAAASDRPFSIGNEDAYVLFTPATATAPAKVVIGGNVQLGSSKTLSQWEAEVQQIGELADLNADAIAGKQDAGDYATADDLAGAVASIGGDVAAKADATETAGALAGLQGYAEELAQGAQAGAEATASALASDAAKKATGYITDISGGGILVHRDDDYDPEGGEVPAHGVRITDTVEIVRGGESMVEVGEQLRVGRADQTHMEGRANRLAFTKDGGDLAWFGQEDEDDPGSPWGLHTGMLYVEDMQRFGGFAWIKRANGNMTLKWIGGGE